MTQTDSELLYELNNFNMQGEFLKAEAEDLSHHIKLHKDHWGFSSWHAGSVSFNPSQIVEQTEKLLSENLNDEELKLKILHAISNGTP